MQRLCLQIELVELQEKHQKLNHYQIKFQQLLDEMILKFIIIQKIEKLKLQFKGEYIIKGEKMLISFPAPTHIYLILYTRKKNMISDMPTNNFFLTL